MFTSSLFPTFLLKPNPHQLKLQFTAVRDDLRVRSTLEQLMPNDENQYLLNSELEVENETLKFVYLPLIRRVAEFNVKWPNNFRVVA